MPKHIVGAEGPLRRKDTSSFVLRRRKTDARSTRALNPKGKELRKEQYMMRMNSFGGNKAETEFDSKDYDGGSRAKWTARTKSRQGIALNLLEDR